MLRRVFRDERGVTTVMFGLMIPTFLLFCVFAVDVGHWFVHKRHLQIQADAAALAGAREFRFPACENGAITEEALRYSGKGDGTTVYNDPDSAHINTPQANLFAEINQPNYHSQSTPSDNDLSGSPGPCEAAMLDVKMTETDLPWFFGTGIVEHINAQARVALFQVSELDQLLPVGVQEATPKKVRAYVIDEETGATVGSTLLDSQGVSGGMQRFDNEAAPLAVTALSTMSRLGVRVALSGSNSTTCGDPLVSCYDSGAATGLSYIRAWSTVPDVTTGQAPRAGMVRLTPVTCTNASFSSASTGCTMRVSAKVRWQPAVQKADLNPQPAVGTTPAKPQKAFVWAVYNGTRYPMTYDPTAGVETWTSGNITVPAGTVGTKDVSLDWEQQDYKVGSDTCKVSGNKCKGTITEGGNTALQRTFWNKPLDQTARGGPIGLLDVLDASTLQQVNDVERCSTVKVVCTYNLVFDVGIKGALSLSGVNDPPVALRVDGNQTQSLQCDPDEGGSSGLENMLALGCKPRYKINSGETCGAKNVVWAAPQPWPCVALRTGDPPNSTPRGLNRRILCNPALGDAANCSTNASATACTHPNKWPDFDTDDPRVVSVFLVPFGTFTGTGLETVPVIGFGTFYVTGYTAQGGGVSTPCAAVTGPDADDYSPDPPPSGNISGHFIKNVVPNSAGSGTESCDFDSVNPCVAVLVK